jgi:hypothetical protein
MGQMPDDRRSRRAYTPPCQVALPRGRAAGDAGGSTCRVHGGDAVGGYEYTGM